MPQTLNLSAPRLAVLKWQVIETDPLGNRWVVAAFNDEGDARAFVQAKTDASDRLDYELRESPSWVSIREEAARELRRSSSVDDAFQAVDL